MLSQNISIRSYIVKAHQSIEGRAKIAIAIFLITALVTSGIIAAYGAIHFGQSGLDPLKFIASVLSEPIFLFGIIPCFVLGNIAYIFKISKSRTTSTNSPKVPLSLPLVFPHKINFPQGSSKPKLPDFLEPLGRVGFEVILPTHQLHTFLNLREMEYTIIETSGDYLNYGIFLRDSTILKEYQDSLIFQYLTAEEAKKMRENLSQHLKYSFVSKTIPESILST